MKTGYKGFNQDMFCKDEQFKIGYIYVKNDKNETVVIDPSMIPYFVENRLAPYEDKSIKLCSNQGYHYCDTLSKVYHHYAEDHNNRFFEIEIIGNYNGDSEKAITRAFRIIKEISKEEKEEIDLEDRFSLDVVRKIQTRYSHIHVGGSVGLYLHGVRINRWKGRSGDVDLITPYYTLLEKSSDFNINSVENDKPSGNDFDDTYIVDGTKVDVRIDNKQRYEIIEYKGFKYKVSSLLAILEAKLRYAMNKGKTASKHEADIEEMVKSKPVKLVINEVDAPF